MVPDVASVLQFDVASFINPNIPLAALACAGGAVWLRSKRKTGTVDKPDKILPREGAAWWFERKRYELPVEISGSHIDIAWRHIGILGTSGARKSSLMAMLIEQIGKRAVVLTGDESPPLNNYIRSTGGLLWQPRGTLAWYPWGGPLEHAVQRCEFLFPATDSDKGVHRSMFKAAARRAWGKVGEAERKVEQVLAELRKLANGGGASAKTMVENWTARLQEMIESLGDSWKTAAEGGFDVVRYLQEEGVGKARDAMFWLNSYVDVSNREKFARVVVLEVLRAADSVGGITLAFDEIGLMGAQLFAEAVRTLRVRLCTGIFASHIAKDYPEILRGLINIWFLGTCGAGDKPTREWSSDTTFGRVPAENFGEHALPLGTFHLVANGRVQKLKVPTWKTRPVPEAVPVVPTPGDTYESEGEGDEGTERLENPPDRRIERYSQRIGVHWVWKETAPVNQTTGYPRLKIDDKYQYVHILWWEYVHGPRGLDEFGEVLTIDHMCEFGIRCVWPGCKQELPRRGKNGNTGMRHQRDRNLRLLA